MKKFVIIIILLLNFILSWQINAQDQSYYHNNEYKFRIRFPEGWDIKDGVGEHIIKKAVFNGASVIVNVTEMKEIPIFIEEIKKDENFKNLSDDELMKKIESEFDSRLFDENEFEEIMSNFISSSIEELKFSLHNLKILENKITYLANEKFIYIK